MMLVGGPATNRKSNVMEVLLLYWRNHDSWVAHFRTWSRGKSDRLKRKSTKSFETNSHSEVLSEVLKGHDTAHISSENKGLSLGVIQRTSHHDRSHAPKFEDRSWEKTKRQELYARGDALNSGWVDT